MSQFNLTPYLDAIRQLKNREFDISFPMRSADPPFFDFENELLQLASWLELQFEEFSKLQNITEDIARGNFLDEVLERIFDSFHKLIPYDRIGCALIDEDTQRLKAQWAKTNYPQRVKVVKGYSERLSGSSLEVILQTGEPRIINDLVQYLKDKPHSVSTRLIVAEGVQSSLTCPLIVEGKPIGFVFFSSKEKNTYRDVHQQIFTHIARQVSILIEKSKLYQHICDLNQQLVDAMEQLKDQSCRDPLTGIFHRGAIMEFLQQNLQVTQRKKHHVSVIMADLDLFKSVNDTYGHPMGDKVLKEVANTIKASLRSCDSIGRYGGEEFLIVLSETDSTGAMVVAERIRQEVAALSFQHPNGVLSVTTSMGISTLDWAIEVKDEKILLEEADKALYQSKHQGRNQVTLAC